jgi:hypothetical protein
MFIVFSHIYVYLHLQKCQKNLTLDSHCCIFGIWQALYTIFVIGLHTYSVVLHMRIPRFNDVKEKVYKFIAKVFIK